MLYTTLGSLSYCSYITEVATHSVARNLWVMIWSQFKILATIPSLATIKRINFEGKIFVDWIIKIFADILLRIITKWAI